MTRLRLLTCVLASAWLASASHGAPDLNKIAAELDGYRFEFPCKDPMPENPKPGADGISARATADPATNDQFTDVKKFGGDPAKRYKVTLRVRGVVEPMMYKDGVQVGERFYVGGAPNNATYNIYQLTVSSPASHFFFNRDDKVGHRIFTIDYTTDIEIDGGATLTLHGNGQNGRMITNFSKLVVPDVPPAPAPFNGQFIQLNVENVVEVKKAAKPTPPTRPFDGPGAPKFIRLDGKPGVNPPVDAEGDFVIGPDYVPAPETKVVEGVPQGKVQQFQIDSKTTKRFNPGIARDEFGVPDPNNPKTLIVKTHTIDYMRTITVYIPAQYVAGTEAPFIVTHDGPQMGKPDKNLPTILDNLIAQKRVPAMIAIMIANGGGDAQGHERGKEYDTMSGEYATYIEEEILPLVEKNYGVKLTKDPEGRATMGSSSGGSAALAMAWYRNDLYHRVLATSGTFVNQQWPFNPETPGGAWEFHNKLIPESPKKPLRIWLAVGDRDNYNPNVMRDNMHDWVEANHRMAKVLKEKGYPYQYVFCLNAGHGIGPVRPQILPMALEWLWKGYAEVK